MPIRTLVVDDSVLFRNFLTSRLPEENQIEVIGSAVSGFDACDKIPKLRPDVLTLDIEMPGMNGIELLKKLMVTHPIPTVLVSALNISVFDALSAGAVDFARKPDASAGESPDLFIAELRRKIKTAAAATPRASVNSAEIPPVRKEELVNSSKLDDIVIAMGASTGGTEATLQVLGGLPAHTPGIVIVQHMPYGFTKMYADRIDKSCAMDAKEAQNGDAVEQGRVLIARGDMHMRLVKIGSKYTVQCSPGEKVSGHCPSVDVLFESAAQAAGASAIGVILTGMGRDGANGLLKMKNSGAYTIGQDKSSCVVYGMPMAAMDTGAVTIQTPLDNISNIIKRQVNKMSLI